MSTLSINPAATPRSSNLAKLLKAWQVISVVLITGYSIVFFLSLGNTPHSRLIYLGIALVLPMIACATLAIGITCYYQQRYFLAAIGLIAGFILTLPTLLSGGLQLASEWGLLS
jgi:hypothetical protein